MNINAASTPRNLANLRIQRFESARDFVGDLPATGKGVTVAVFDSGIYPMPDVNDRLAASITVREEGRPDSDRMGHGTAVAGVIAGNGSSSMGKFRGVAPDARLVNVQTFPPQGDRPPSVEQIYAGVLNGIDWCVDHKDEYNIRVINISAGLQLFAKFDENQNFQMFLDPLREGMKKAIDAGISVVAAAGNDGPGPNTIDRTPSIEENVITVGALDTNGTPADSSDDKVATFSSRGPTVEGKPKPDILAPGVGIMCPIVPLSDLAQKNEGRQALAKKLEQMDSPHVLGVLADKIRNEELYSGVVKEAIPPLREAVIKVVKPEVGERLKTVQDTTVMAFTAKLLEKGVVKEQDVKQPLDNLRTLAIENLQPRPTKFFLIDGNPAYLSLDGTSFAAPIVSGVVADMYEVNPDLKPADVQQILRSTATALPGVTADDGGAGALNARAAIAEAARRRQG